MRTTSLSAIAAKSLAAALSAVLFVQPLLADASQASVWRDRRVRALAMLPAAALPPLSSPSCDLLTSARPTGAATPLASRVAPDLGRISRILPAAGARRRAPVFFIQDVHGALDAQTNIRAAVAALAADPSRPVLALEGAAGPLSIERYRRFSQPAVMAAAADFLLSEVSISGPARAALADPALDVVGIDDATLHERNAAAYREAAPRVASARAALAAASAALDRDRAALPADLRAFDDAVRDFRAGRLTLSAYAARLAPYDARGELTSFLDAARLEASIDFARAESERARLVEMLAQKASPADLTTLARNAMSLRTGDLAPADFYRAFAALCAKHGVPLDRAPTFAAYVRYVTLVETIDGAALWSSLTRLERTAYDRLSTSPEARRVVARSRALGLISRLLEFSLTPEEWAEYKTAVSRELRAENNSGSQLSALSAQLKPFEDFYREAERRDAAMARNVAALPDRPVLLVAGGFHAHGLADRLAAAGHPVVVWTPAVKAADAGSTARALGVFAREKTPLEDLFRGEKLFLADNPFRGLTKVPPLVAALSADPQAAVDEVLPGAGVSVSVKRSDTGDDVLLRRDGRTARANVRHRGLKILGFRQSAGGRSFTNDVFERLARRSASAAAAFAIAAGFVQEFVARMKIGAVAAALVGLAHVSGVPFVVPALLPVLVVAYAVYFATAEHPAGRFLGLEGTAPLSARHRWMLFAVGLGLGVLQACLLQGGLPIDRIVASSAFLGVLHAAASVTIAVLGGPFAMSDQKPSSTDRLMAVVSSRNARRRTLAALSDEALLTEGRRFLAEARIGEMTDEKIGWGVALFSEAAERAAASDDVQEDVRPFIGGTPSDRQIEAMLAMLGRRRVVAMRPSEGKTLAVALTAFIVAATGRKVEVHDWNNMLTMRDAQVAGAILSRLGVSVGARLNERQHNNQESTNFVFDPTFVRSRRAPHLKAINNHHTNAGAIEATRSLYADCDIVYGPYDRMIFDWMSDWYFRNGLPLHSSLMPQWVLTEESDTPFLDAADDPFVMASPDRPMTPRREKFFRTIYGFALSLRPGKDNDYEINGGIRFSSQSVLRARLGELRARLAEQHSQPLATDRLEDLLLAALEAIHLFRRDIDYFVVNRRVVIRDPMTGEAKQQRRWARGLHTFIEIKESIAHKAERDEKWLEDESSIQAIMTTPVFYNLIPAWSGVAGVMDPDTERQIRDIYGAEPVLFDPYFASLLTEREPRYFRTADEKIDAIVEAALAIRQTGRPVLINAGDPLEARRIYDRLASAIPRDGPNGNGLRLVDGRDEEADKHAWNRMGLRNAVTVAAQVASRGHEIKIEDSLYEPAEVPGWGTVAGLTVISTHHAPMERLEAQVRTRAGRRGKPGTFQLMEHLEHNEFLERYAADELRALLAQPDPETRRGDIVDLFDLARRRSADGSAKTLARLNGQFRRIILAHLQLAELIRLAIRQGEDASHLAALAADLVHRANAAVQTRDEDAFRATLDEFHQQIRFYANLVHDPGLSFADDLPLGERLLLLRQTVGVSQQELTDQAGISQAHYIDAEKGRTERPLTVLKALEGYYIGKRHLTAESVRRVLGKRPWPVLLPGLQGRPLTEVLIALRENEWLTQDDMGRALHPSIDGRSYGAWELGEVVPLTEQRRQIALHFADDFGYDYLWLCRLLNVRDPRDVMRDLQGLPLKDVLRGLRGDMPTVEAAKGMGVGTNTILSWEAGTQPDPPNMRAIINFYAQRGFPLQQLKPLLGIPTGEEAAARFAGKNRVEILELIRATGPYDANEWYKLLGVSRTWYSRWAKNPSSVPTWKLRDLESQVVELGVPLAAYRQATGVPSPEELAARLRGQPMDQIIAGLRAYTGRTWKEAADALHVPEGRYKNWEKKPKPTRPARADRLRLVAFYALRYKIPRTALREMMDVPSTDELFASLAGRPITESIPHILRIYDDSASAVAEGIHLGLAKVYGVIRDGVRDEAILNAVAIYLHDHHNLPLDRLEALFGLREAPPSEGTGGVLGMWPAWKALRDWAVAKDHAKGTWWRLAVVAAVTGFAEEAIARPLLGLLPLAAPLLGLNPLATFAVGLGLYAVAFATRLHRSGYVGRNDAAPLKRRQRALLLLLAAGLGLVQYYAPLPAWGLYLILGAAHAVFNLVQLWRGGVLAMSLAPRSASREERVGAALAGVMAAVEDGAVDRGAFAAHLNTALAGAEAPETVGENPFDRTVRDLKDGRLDPARVRDAVQRARTSIGREPLSTTAAFRLLAKAQAAGPAAVDPLTAPLAPTQTGTVWVMDGGNAGRAGAVARQAADAPNHRLLIVVTDPALLAAARALGRDHSNIDVVLDDGRVLLGAGDARRIDLAALERAAVDAWGAAFWTSADLRVLTPPVRLDVNGLAGDSRLRAALFLLDAVPLSFNAVENAARLAEIVGRQA